MNEAEERISGFKYKAKDLKQVIKEYEHIIKQRKTAHMKYRT